MFRRHIAPFTALQRIADWHAYFLPTQLQAPMAAITRQQPSVLESRLRLAKSLRQSAEFYRERLETFKNRPEEEDYFRLEAERCENAARQIEMAERRA